MSTHFTKNDQVRMFLISRHTKEIQVGQLVDLATEAGMTAVDFRDTLKVLEKKGEITLEKVGMTRAQRVTAIIVNKLATPEKIVEQTLEVKKVVSKPEKILSAKAIPLILDYAKKKAIVEETKNRLMEEGIEGVEITFDMNPLGEESMMLLDLIERAQGAINTLTEERDHFKNSFETLKEATQRSKGMNKPNGDDTEATTEASI